MLAPRVVRHFAVLELDLLAQGFCVDSWNASHHPTSDLRPRPMRRRHAGARRAAAPHLRDVRAGPQGHGAAHRARVSTDLQRTSTALRASAPLVRRAVAAPASAPDRRQRRATGAASKIESLALREDAMTTIDLRSDTVTRPTPAMREAMARAEVGDDQYGEDPTTNRLQQRIAELLGKEAALWLPSGTMSNQVAALTLARPGDEIVAAREAHASWHEVGAAAANAGVQIVEVGAGGVFSAEQFEQAIKPAGLPMYPPTTVVEIENTHNRASGVVFPQDEAVRICTLARSRGIASFLDGARLWNAAVASGRSEAELAAPFDLVSVAFSKGLGAPAGSLLAGTREAIARAGRHRRRLGGAMRQVGILAAAALHGVEHHRARLAEDHANARRLAERLAACRHVQLDLATVQTNIVVFQLKPGAPDAPTLAARAREQGVLVGAFAARTVRVVTHLDVSAAMCDTAALRLCGLLD
jgi:threonine aldolase